MRHLLLLLPALCVTTMIASGCGGGDNDDAPLHEAATGPGTYRAGPTADPYQVASLCIEAPAGSAIHLQATVAGLVGDAFWKVTPADGAPITGRLQPDLTGTAWAHEELAAAASGRTYIELFVLAPAHTEASWQSARLQAR